MSAGLSLVSLSARDLRFRPHEQGAGRVVSTETASKVAENSQFPPVPRVGPNETQAAVLDALETVGIWVGEGLAPAEVLEAMGFSGLAVHRRPGVLGWPAVFAVMLADLDGSSGVRHA